MCQLQVYSKVIQLYIYIYIHICVYIFFLLLILKYLFTYLFVWLHQVLVAAHRIFIAACRIFQLWCTNSWLWPVASSSLTRDQTRAPCIGSVEPQLLDHQGSPQVYIFFLRFFSFIGYYKILSRVPCAIQQVLVGYLFYIQQCVYVNPNLLIHSSYYCYLNKTYHYYSSGPERPSGEDKH